MTGPFLPEASNPEEDPYKDDSQNMEPGSADDPDGSAPYKRANFPGKLPWHPARQNLHQMADLSSASQAASLFAESMVAAGGLRRRGGASGTRSSKTGAAKCPAHCSLSMYYLYTKCLGTEETVSYEDPVQDRRQKVEGRLQGWLHRHPRMYQTLTGLGVKRLYIVLKRRAAR